MYYIISKDKTKSYDEDQLEELKTYYKYNLEEEKELFNEYIKDGLITKEKAKESFLKIKEFNNNLDDCKNIIEAAKFLNNNRDFASIYEEYIIKEYNF